MFVVALAEQMPVPVLVGVALLVLTRHRKRRRRTRLGAAGIAPLPHRPPPPPRPVPPRPDAVWAHARQRFAALRGEYAAYECDPMAVLRLPALSDVTVPSTGRFVEAFAEAQALETDAFPPESARHGRSSSRSSAPSGPGARPATPPSGSACRTSPRRSAAPSSG